MQLSRLQTDLFWTCRTFKNESKSQGNPIGDYFVWLGAMVDQGVISTNLHNTIVDFYNNAEGEADAGSLTSTEPDGSHENIGAAPNRPRPIHK